MEENWSTGEFNEYAFVGNGPFEYWDILGLARGNGNKGSNEYDHLSTQELKDMLEALRRRGHLTKEENVVKNKLVAQEKFREVRNVSKARGGKRAPKKPSLKVGGGTAGGIAGAIIGTAAGAAISDAAEEAQKDAEDINKQIQDGVEESRRLSHPPAKAPPPGPPERTRSGRHLRCTYKCKRISEGGPPDGRTCQYGNCTIVGVNGGVESECEINPIFTYTRSALDETDCCPPDDHQFHRDTRIGE